MLLTAIVHQYPPLHNAGAEWYLHSMLRWMVNRGHQAQVYVSRGRSMTWDGVKINVFRSTGQNIQGDVLITHLDLTRQAIEVSKRRKIPLIHIIHNDRQLQFHTVARQEADLVVFNSHWIERAVGWHGRHMVVQPPVFVKDYEHIGYSPERCATTLINLSRAKGAEIFWALAEADPDRTFLGVRGAYGEQMEPAVRPPNVVVMDQTPDVRQVYDVTKVLLMPSSYESFGRVAIEAACQGIPTIASPTPGLREALNSAGIFVHQHPTHQIPASGIATQIVPEQGPIEAWQEKLRQLDDPAFYAQASQVAYARALQLQDHTDAQLERLEKELANL